MKYYRVLKDSFLWKSGAILSDKDKGEYSAVEDIWDMVPTVGNEYITAKVVEHPTNSEFFERVYPDTITGKLFRTKDQLTDLYNKTFN